MVRGSKCSEEEMKGKSRVHKHLTLQIIAESIARAGWSEKATNRA